MTLGAHIIVVDTLLMSVGTNVALLLKTPDESLGGDETRSVLPCNISLVFGTLAFSVPGRSNCCSFLEEVQAGFFCVILFYFSFMSTCSFIKYMDSLNP